LNLPKALMPRTSSGFQRISNIKTKNRNREVLRGKTVGSAKGVGAPNKFGVPGDASPQLRNREVLRGKTVGSAKGVDAPNKLMGPVL
jgi:hypothetical protein